MSDLFASLPASDRRLVQNMCEDCGVPVEALLVQIIREYLGLVKAAPAALPKSPVFRLTAENVRREGN